jgi:beta-lactamase class A
MLWDTFSLASSAEAERIQLVFKKYSLSLLFLSASFAPAFAQTACSSSALTEQFSTLARDSQGKVGVSAFVVETGAQAGLHADQHFPMQSVYKLPIAMAVLARVDRGELSLDQKVRLEKRFLLPAGMRSPLRDQYPEGGVDLPLRQLLAFSIVESDGVASDVLLSLVSPAQVTDYLRSIGITEMMVAMTEKEVSQDTMMQYRNWATPEAAVALLKKLQNGDAAQLSLKSRELVWQWMTESTPGAKRIKGLLPKHTPVAHKTGTDGTVNGLTRATNDIGIVTMPGHQHLLLAVFVADSMANEATREKVIAETAHAAWACWAK